MIIVENIYPSPPNKPRAFFFQGIYVTVLPSALETILGEGGEAEGALTHEQCVQSREVGLIRGWRGD